MSPQKRRLRTSRSLIGILVVVVVLGTALYVHKTRRIVAKDVNTVAAVPPAVTPEQLAKKPDAPAASAAPATPVNLLDATPALVTSTPSTRPAGAASTGAASNAGMSLPATAQPTGASNNTIIANTTAASAQPLADAGPMIDTGNLVAARRTLNASLVSGKLAPADAQAVKQKIAELNQTLFFSPRRFADDEAMIAHTVRTGELMQKIALSNGVTWELLGRINNIADPRRVRAGQTIKVPKGPLHAVVDKRAFTVDVWQGQPEQSGSLYITTFRCGLGRDDSTPTGTWQVTQGGKLKNPKFWGAGGLPPKEADDPENPLGEFWIALTGVDGSAVGQQSYGIHGTIQPESIGQQASLGCIRMRNEDVAQVYELLVDGRSTVVVR